MKFTEIVLFASIVEHAAAFWRMNCPSRLLWERADPIVSPGQVSSHVHSISGGNGFGFNMDYKMARESTCSSCPIKQDFSNYWTPTLYFHARNGSYIAVPQTGDYAGMLGGMAVYYLQRGGPNNDALKAFPEGFRMTAGDPLKRNYTNDFASKAVSFACLDANAGQRPYIPGFPKIDCPDGMRLQVFFPSCWDGKNLDSPDHRSHMAYPESGSFDSGPCPASHPVHLISIFYEVNYDTGRFKDEWTPDGQNQPFVLSSGDPTGYGFHGDFINGWDVPTLQRAIGECTDNSGDTGMCHVFDLYDDDECHACKIPPSVHEDLLGPMAKLPGCNPIQGGPQAATSLKGTSSCQDSASITTPTQPFVDFTKSGWAYVGCAHDDVGDRTLQGSNSYNDTETLRKCLAYCSARGYEYAGAEYSTQCYCDHSLRKDRVPGPTSMGQCTMKCGGSNAMCGGGAALSLYKKCSGASCVNAGFKPVNPSNVGHKLAKRDAEPTWDPEGVLTYEDALVQGLALSPRGDVLVERDEVLVKRDEVLMKRDDALVPREESLDEFTARSRAQDARMGMEADTASIEGRGHARDFSRRMY